MSLLARLSADRDEAYEPGLSRRPTTRSPVFLLLHLPPSWMIPGAAAYRAGVGAAERTRCFRQRMRPVTVLDALHQRIMMSLIP